MLISASLIVQLVKNLPAMQETPIRSWVGKICYRRDRLPTPVFLGFPCGSSGKESACNAEDLGSIPGLGRSPGERKGYPLQYSGQENSMGCIVHGVAKSWTWLSDIHSFTQGGPSVATPFVTRPPVLLTSWCQNRVESCSCHCSPGTVSTTYPAQHRGSRLPSCCSWGRGPFLPTVCKRGCCP